MRETRGAYLMNLGQTGYREAWSSSAPSPQRSTQGAIPDTVLLLEHPPTITLGRRTDAGEVHIPAGVAVELSRPTAAASRPTTGRDSSSATRSST